MFFFLYYIIVEDMRKHKYFKFSFGLNELKLKGTNLINILTSL